jgi:ribosomal protein S27AE
MRKCPSCGQLTLDEVRDRDRWECTRNVSCGYVEPFVTAKDARIAELEAQVARLSGMPAAESHSVTLPREEDADLRPLVGDPPALRKLDVPDDSALLDALERMVIGSAEHGEEVELDARHEGHGVLLTSWHRWTCDFGSGEHTGPDLRAAIRAAMEASGGE